MVHVMVQGTRGWEKIMKEWNGPGDSPYVALRDKQREEGKVGL